MDGMAVFAGFALLWIWIFPMSFGAWLAKVKNGYDKAMKDKAND